MARTPGARNVATRPTTTEVDEDGVILPPRQRGDMRETAANVEFGRDLPSGFKIAKYVSVPMLEVPPGQSVCCQLIDKVRVLPPLLDENGVPRPNKIKGDHLASTIRSSNGEARLFTWTTVFRSEMERAYPEDAYVGKWFMITKLPMKAGKDYSTYSITELEYEAA